MLRTVFILLLSASVNAGAQSTAAFADSIRRMYRVPELSYAVVSADSVFEINALGVRKVNTDLAATLQDRFRIGSNTKAITGYIAALLVKQGKISWDTRFFDLFPEMKAGSRKEYYNLTLLNLLTFRTRLIRYTYTDAQPTKQQFTGNEDAQRHQFAAWFFKQAPLHNHDAINFSNLGYVAAGLMLEKASGASYQKLVTDLGNSIGAHFGFGPPNLYDSLQTWGHNAALEPESPSDNYKLDWLPTAGNINATLPDYLKFIQLQLKGLSGRSPILSQQEFNFLHFGLPEFSVGWFPGTDEQGRQFSYNIGNPGTFLTKVYVFRNMDLAFIVFANAQTGKADEALTVLYEALKARYSR